ncbi:hypothetical protein WP5S18E05_P10660 (plasmid) [Klebsiella quasipneumoniae]|nr:hypothetical protein WP5S18E05_P10660 [Klebsiella quasipneumoniae]
MRRCLITLSSNVRKECYPSVAIERPSKGGIKHVGITTILNIECDFFYKTRLSLLKLHIATGARDIFHDLGNRFFILIKHVSQPQ